MFNQKTRPIIIIALVTAVCLIGDSMLYVVLPTHWQDMGLSSLWQIGIILSVNRLIRLPLNPLVSYLYRKISARNGILIALLLAISTTAGYGIVNNFYIFILLRCIWGFAWTFLRLGAYFTIIDYSTDQNRGKCMGLYNGLYRLGSLFGMLFGGISADFFGVKITSFTFAFCSLICIPVIFTYIKKSSRGMVAEQTEKESNFSFFENTHILPTLCIGLFISMIYQGMFTSTLSYLIELHNNSNISIGFFIIGAASLGGIIQAIRWSWEPWLAPLLGSLTDQTQGRYSILIISTAIASISFSIISFNMPLAVWLALLLILQITATSLTTIADALAADIAINSAKIKIMTLYSLLIDLGAALGPMLAYFMNQYFNPYASYWGAACILLIITLKYSTKAVSLKKFSHR
ncbi:MFS transporter [Pectinatus haikarae]|uniref:MFS transporter n=1 Tax=Pectinatus haikarae TaxID=349096 RepID=UPI0018C7A55E|nr:MFS transporter [Pectinatus haikarae]